MTPEQLTTVVTNILTSSGIIIFLSFTYRALKRKIKGLNDTIEAQKQTLEVMEKRISETEKVGEVYKNLIKELPEYLDSYKKIIHETKDERIADLERANLLKDEKLRNLTEAELKKLELQEQALAEIPKLRDDLIHTSKALNLRFKSLSVSFGPGTGKAALFEKYFQHYIPAQLNSYLIYFLLHDELLSKDDLEIVWNKPDRGKDESTS